MKTLTADEAGQNLAAWLSRALKGEDIGILCEGKIVALRPVEPRTEDYALTEYGVTAEEVERLEEKLLREIAAEGKAGLLKEWKP